VWASGYSGAGQVVAILDTGVDKNHTFLTGKVVSEACYSKTATTASYTATSVCPGAVTSSTAAGSAMPYAGNCPSGGCDHGTHVAGIVAGKDPGSLGYNGVAKDAHLIAIQVFTRVNKEYCGTATDCVLSFTSDQVLALQRVYDLRTTYSIASVNMSLGGGRYYNQTSCDADNSSPNIARKAAIDNLRAVGIATVIASGNNGYTDSMGSPGCISSAISVGSTQDGSYSTTVDAVSSFSNSVSFLSLLAPGQWITSSLPGNNYATWDGTSMATPHVAGAWAVLKSKFPGASVDQILNVLKSTGKAITDPRNGVTTPRIRLDQAAQGYSISGKVTIGSPGGAGLAGVTINAGGGHTATTDASGNYTISGLLGTYTLTPSLGTNVFTPAASSPITVGPNATDVNFVAQTYTISGKVTIGSAGGAGLPGVTVTVDASHSATTDASGNYTISNLLAGAKTVTPSLGTNVFSPVSTAVTVGPSKTGINFYAQVYSISGKVTIGSLGGAALAGVTVSADASHSAVTNASGAYTISNLPAGTYTVTPSLGPNSFTPASTQVTVGGSKTGINFFAQTYTISGKVTIGTAAGAGKPSVTVRADASHSAVTNASGNYTISNLLAGTYTLAASPIPAGHAFKPVSVQVTVGPNATGINFIDITGYTVAGKITVGSVSGPGLAGVTVSIDASHTETSDASGNFIIFGLAAGNYTLTPTKAEYTFVPVSIPVTVAASNLSGKDFVATQKVYTVSGKVTLGSGAGAPGLSGVTVVDGAGHTAITNANGNYTLSGLIKGSYIISSGKAKYTFSPHTVPLNVSSNQTGVNFAGTFLPRSLFLPLLKK
jgi:subtilisin family serine protease